MHWNASPNLLRLAALPISCIQSCNMFVLHDHINHCSSSHGISCSCPTSQLHWKSNQLRFEKFNFTVFMFWQNRRSWDWNRILLWRTLPVLKVAFQIISMMLLEVFLHSNKKNLNDHGYSWLIEFFTFYWLIGQGFILLNEAVNRTLFLANQQGISHIGKGQDLPFCIAKILSECICTCIWNHAKSHSGGEFLFNIIV